MELLVCGSAGEGTHRNIKRKSEDRKNRDLADFFSILFIPQGKDGDLSIIRFVPEIHNDKRIYL